MNETLLKLEYMCVFLLPIFLATIYNNINKKKIKPNMKIVYYKFFMFFAILFIASQINIDFSSMDKSYAAYVGGGFRFIGNLLMFLLILEFFIIPNTKDHKHPDDIVVFHTTILWITVVAFLLCGSLMHFENMSKVDKKTNEWKNINSFDIIKRVQKVFNDVALPNVKQSNVNATGVEQQLFKEKELPYCCLFSGTYPNLENTELSNTPDPNLEFDKKYINIV